MFHSRCNERFLREPRRGSEHEADHNWSTFLSTASFDRHSVSPRSNKPEAMCAKTPVWDDLREPSLYLNRELTWLAYNRRVLDEAKNLQTPLLERLKFLAIVSSNLDEFFMKRIGGLKHQVSAGYTKTTVDGRTPQQQITECAVQVRELIAEKAEIAKAVLAELRNHNVHLHCYEELSDAERKVLRENYERDVLPLVTPLGLDSSHPFPHFSNLSVNLLVTFIEPGQDESLILVRVPAGPCSPRFVRIGKDHRYVALEEIVAHNLDLLLPDCEVKSCQPFRITRHASPEHDEEGTEDLLAMIEAELRNREFLPCVRLEMGPEMAPAQRNMLAKNLQIDPAADIYTDHALLGMADLMQLAGLDIPALHDIPHEPVTNPLLPPDRGVFESIRLHGSILLQFPRESFATSVERFVTEASEDPDVLAIKATLYRTSASTGIVDSLVKAAHDGKHVVVMVELKARFDEAANVVWARRLEEAGVHVSYGIENLKTHCKALFVVRRENNELNRYVHVSTGNYHAGTARVYADFGLLSCDEELCEDIADLFNVLTSGRNISRTYRKALTAPDIMKKSLIAKILREIEHHSEDSPGHIRLKTNALEDSDIVEALYRAGRAGVRIELFVRDTCRLRPGLTGLSENITVIATISRFLEHARVYYFRNGGNEEYYIGSADLMQRNLEHRIELLVPVEGAALRETLSNYLDKQRRDRQHSWHLHSDGRYTRQPPVTATQHPRSKLPVNNRMEGGCATC